jgi:hypothetical protein
MIAYQVHLAPCPATISLLDNANITRDLTVFQALIVRFVAEAQAPDSLLSRELDDLCG